MFTVPLEHEAHAARCSYDLESDPNAYNPRDWKKPVSSKCNRSLSSHNQLGVLEFVFPRKATMAAVLPARPADKHRE